VPRQDSSGGKNRILGISKRVDFYLRALAVHGARAVMLRAERKNDALSQWAFRLNERRGRNRAIVTLTNTIIRIVWVILTRRDIYHPHTLEVIN
jgi:transposase